MDTTRALKPKPNITVLLLSILLCLSCQEKESDPAPVNITLLSLTVDESYTFDNEKWVFINDVNGALLDSKKITTGEVIEFQTSQPVPNNMIAITVFSHESSEFSESYTFSSYMSIPAGEAWTLRTPPVTQSPGSGANVGSFNVSYTLPVPTIMDVFGSGFSLGHYNLNGNTKVHTMGIFEKNKNFLLSIAGDGNPRYKFFENVANGQNYQLTYDEMSEFDQILDISFPTVSNPYVKVAAFDADGLNHYYTYYNGFNLPPFAQSSTSTGLKIGYLNRFAKYHTVIQLAWPNFAFSYTKAGGVPGSITIPDEPYYEILDKTFSGFSYSSEKPFSSRKSQFIDDTAPANTSISWVVTAPEGTDKIVALPDDFLAEYPFIGIEKYKHVSTTFYISNTTYADEIGSLFKEQRPEAEIETTAITVR